MTTRYAFVTLAWERDNPKPYMPGNYQVVLIEPHPDANERRQWRRAIIVGEDNAGWSLDEYVLPRLASGGMYGREMTSEEVAELQVPDQQGEAPEAGYRLWVNDDRTLLVRQWREGLVEVLERDHPDDIWGLPVKRQALPSWIDNLTEEVIT